ncbi:MAG: PKD-like domain-containing protein, partial [Saprospiraceae bacterium]
MNVFTRLLLPASILLLGIFSSNLLCAASAERPSGNPEAATGKEALPVLITYTWTGTVSTDWHDPFNWSPMGTPLSGSLAGDDVVIPVVVSGNYPVVMASARARSISIASGASLTVNVGGTLNVIASTTDGVTNAGTLTNNGTMRVDSSANDGIVNQLNALITNSGTLTIIEGTGNRLENYATVTNTGGTFTVDGGLGIGLINHPGATITNSGGTFQVRNGTNQRVDNYGSITNSATFTIDGASAGFGLINRAGASIANNAGTFAVQFGTDRRVDNYGTITNSASFTIAGASTGEGLINRANASITNNGGTFSVSGGTATRVDNYGTITNAANFTIGAASTGEGLINRANASITNSGGTFSVSGGNAVRVDNYSTITNSATFNIGGAGSGQGLINRTGTKVLNNSGSFTVQSGSATLVENDGKIENSGTFSIQNTSGSEALVNRDSVINKTGATFTVQAGTGRLLKNSKYVGNSGTMNIRQSINFNFPELVINELGAVLFNDNGAVLLMGTTGATQQIFTNHGTFQDNGKATLTNCGTKGLYNSSTGVVEVQDSLGINSIGGQAIVNENSFTLGASGKLDIGNNIGGGGIKNSDLFVTNIGCRLTAGSMTNSAITNDAGAVFTNNCATTFGGANADKITNNGRYTHLNGSMTLSGTGHPRFMGNNDYAEINVPFTTPATIAKYFYNSDTLILGDQCIFPPKTFINQVFENAAGAYLYSDAEFNFTNMDNFLDNKGKAVLGPSSKYVGSNLSSSNVISNSNTGTLYLQGEIKITKFGGNAINNTGYVEQSGSFISTNTDKGILNNGGTFVNSGSLQLDSISQNALLLQGAQSFTNTSTGTLSLKYNFGDGIRNEAGIMLNEGMITIGQQDTMGRSGIFNNANFTNKNLITIGGGTGHFGHHGIANSTAGNFLNRGSISIGAGAGKIYGAAIKNEFGFVNDHCADISVFDSLDNSGTFDNYGLLTINTSKPHTNTGTFTNHGTITFVIPGTIPGLIEDPYVVTCPDDQTSCQYADPLDLSTLSASPGGGTYSGTGVSSNMFDPTTAGPGTHTITYAIHHYDGCETTCTFDIEVIAAPVATATPSPESVCSGNETNIALGSNVANSTFTWVVQSASGNVSGQADDSGNAIAQTLSVNDGNPGTVVYRITPTGPAPHYCVGQTTDVTVNVSTNQITSITCPGPLTVTCAGQVPAPDPDLISGTDLCGNTLEASHLFTSPPYNVDCLNRFQRTRWYQVEDEGGNTASCSQVITVYDDVKPNFTAVPANVTV